MRDLIIIGAGPAGLGAAVYGKRAGFDTVVMEKTGMSGGQILNTYEVDNYLGLPGINGFELGMKFREHAENMGVEFLDENVIDIKKQNHIIMVETEQTSYECKAVILAMGASYRKLEVLGEESFLGRGVSYCATCDGAFYRNKTVAVVGGGDVAVEDAIFLARSCEKVYLIHRREELRAAKMLQEKLFAMPNVEFFWNSQVKEIQGDGQVASVEIWNKVSNEKTSLPVQGIFVAVGVIPNTGNMEMPIKMDENGYIEADEDGVTDVPGIFVAGDVRTKQLRQVITAVSDGANAITSVENYFISKLL